MVRDAVELEADNLYIAEMMGRIQRFQSYAETAFVEVIEEQAYTDWYFLLSAQLQDQTGSIMPYTRIAMVRELSAALRRITINNEENLFLRFMRVASNSDLDINLEGLNRIWLGLLDRAIFIYLTWLLISEPRECLTYLTYLRTFSSKRSNWMRSVLTDSQDRVVELLRLTELSEAMESNRADSDFFNTQQSALEVEETVRTFTSTKPSGHAVTIIDDAEDINLGQAQTVSVVTKLVEDKGLPKRGRIDESTRKAIQSRTSNLSEDDPRVLGGTAALMGLPTIDDDEAMDPGRVLAFLIIFTNAHANLDVLKERFPLVQDVIEQGRMLEKSMGHDAGLAQKVALARRCVSNNADLFAILK